MAQGDHAPPRAFWHIRASAVNRPSGPRRDALSHHRSGQQALASYRPKTYLLTPDPEASFSRWRPDRRDRLILGVAGAFAGLIGIAIGEISNTFLTAKKKVPVKISTGTSALILHVTILSGLAVNLLILKLSPAFFRAEEIAIPWRVAVIIAPVVIVGGRIGAFINSRLKARTILKGLITVYLLTGSAVFFMLFQTSQ